MNGILGRKLGMTQIFDPETGGVTAVTVIEAGPCPVTHVRSEATDGKFQINVVNADGSDPHQVTDRPGTWANEDPAWSPDSTRIGLSTSSPEN